MDLHERHKDGSAVENRHPWELSRTKKVLEVFGKYLDKRHGEGGEKYINIGAGDQYFDHRLLKRYARTMSMPLIWNMINPFRTSLR